MSLQYKDRCVCVGWGKSFNSYSYLEQCLRIVHAIRVFHSLYKVGRNGNIGIKGFKNTKKEVTSSGARPDARDYYWFKSPTPNQDLGRHLLVRMRL